MITYYERLEDGTIGQSVDDLTLANELGLTLATDEEIIILNCFPNGDKRYLKSEFKEIEQTAEYETKKRLEEIELELNQAEIEYETTLNTPVLYTNNKLYKPKWSNEIYVTLLTAGQLSPERFPVSIWDASELEENMTLMSFMELSLLTNFLGDIKETAFNTRKETRSKLLAEKRELEE